MESNNIKITAENKEFHPGIKPSFSSSFLVFNTSTRDCCCFNGLSSDQMGQLNFSASAKYSTSLMSGQTFFASCILSKYSSDVTIFTLCRNNEKAGYISSSSNPDLSHISCQYLPISNNIQSVDMALFHQKTTIPVLFPFLI